MPSCTIRPFRSANGMFEVVRHVHGSDELSEIAEPIGCHHHVGAGRQTGAQLRSEVRIPVELRLDRRERAGCRYLGRVGLLVRLLSRHCARSACALGCMRFDLAGTGGLRRLTGGLWSAMDLACLPWPSLWARGSARAPHGPMRRVSVFGPPPCPLPCDGDRRRRCEHHGNDARCQSQIFHYEFLP